MYSQMDFGPNDENTYTTPSRMTVKNIWYECEGGRDTPNSMRRKYEVENVILFIIIVLPFYQRSITL